MSQCIATELDDICEGFGGYGVQDSYFEGAFTTIGPDSTGRQIRIYRLMQTQTGPYDCVPPGACELRVFTDITSPPIAPIPLAFDPDMPPLSGPTITLRPGSGLADGEPVGVRISGLNSEFYEIDLCPATAGERGWCASVHEGIADGDGNASVVLRLPRNIVDPLVLGTPTIDCAIFACRLHVTDGRFDSSVELDFDGAIPRRPEPRVTALTDGVVEPGDRVTISGTGFSIISPDRIYRPWWALCETRPATFADIAGLCGEGQLLGGAALGPDGSFAGTVRIPDPARVTTQTRSGEALDCADECWLLVVGGAVEHLSGFAVDFE